MDYPFTGTVNHSFKGNFQWGVQSFHGLQWFNLSSSFDWSIKLAFISQSVVQNLDHWRRCCSYLPQVQITYLFLFWFVSSSQCFLVIFVFVLVAIAITEVSVSRRSAQICSIIFIGFVVFCTVYCSNPYNILLLASCTVVRSWCSEQQRGRAGCCTSSQWCTSISSSSAFIRSCQQLQGSPLCLQTLNKIDQCFLLWQE